MSSDLDRLRRRSRWLSSLTLVLFSLTAAAIILAVGLPWFSQGAAPARPVPLLCSAMLMWMPAACYLYALWAVRAGFREFGGGAVFGPVMASSCTRAGWALSSGGTMSALIVPNLRRVLIERGVFAGMVHPFSGILHFDVAYLAVGVIGLALILLGGLLRRAAELQAEAAELRDELGGFL